MRFIIYGTGAIGATVAGRLKQSGHDVIAIARGAHARALRERGLVLESHDGRANIALTVVEHPSEVAWRADDVVLLGVKTQDAIGALDALAATAPADIPVVLLQNGVETERLAARRFEHVYGICVMLPAVHLEPGVVQAFGTPLTGVLDIGRFPRGRDALSERVAAALSASTFASEARDDILQLKYAKLLVNLGNAIDALCGPSARGGRLADLARQEAELCFAAAGIAYDRDLGAKRARAFTAQPLGDQGRPGSSSWQSLARATGSIETDYLNGEIVLLGRLWGVPTPVNALLQRLSNERARARLPPGGLVEDVVLSLLTPA